MPCSRASATIFSKNGSSTHCAVGFDGKLMISIFGFGKLVRIARSSSAKKSTSGRHRHVADVGAGDHRAVDVDRVARVRHQHRVAAAERGEREVRDAFLRADRDDRLGVGVELDAVAALVPVADRAAQPRDALRHRVAVRVGPLHRLDQLVDDVLRRRAVGVAHAEVDDVLAAAARGHLQLGGDVEDVRRQALMRANSCSGEADMRVFLRKRPEPSERRESVVNLQS